MTKLFLKFVTFCGKICCSLGSHKTIPNEHIHGAANVAGGWHCARKGCNWKIDPIVWPRE